MYQLKFFQSDNTFYETDFQRNWVSANSQQRVLKRAEAKDRGGSIYRKLWTLWLPGGIRIRITRDK